MSAGAFDFDTVVDRSKYWTEKHDLKCVNFEANADAIPMWVADMDFAISPEIHKAIKDRAEHPTFGYTLQPDELWTVVANWFRDNHGWSIDNASFIWSPTVMLSASFCLRAFSNPGDSVMVLTPLYAHLQDMVEGEGRKIIRHSLKPTLKALGAGESLAYTVDLKALEAELAAERVRILVMCNPHNPGAKVWSREELSAIVGICRRNNTLILSDEIHCDWCLFDNKHVPIATVAGPNEVITLSGPGKTFGIPGLQGSFIVIADAEMRKKYMSVVDHTLAHEGGVFGTVAMHAAYSKGKPWLDAVKKYVEGNVLEVESFVAAHLPEVKAWRPQATFLMWLDFSAFGLAAEEVQATLVKGGVCLSAGNSFGDDGKAFQRLNIACSRHVLREALQRIQTAFGAKSRL